MEQIALLARELIEKDHSDRLQREKDCLEYNHDLYVNAMLMKDWDKAEFHLENTRRSMREIKRLESDSYLELHNSTFSILKEGR